MILGLVEHADGQADELSLQMVGLGRRLADETGDGFEAVLIGDDAKASAQALSAYGVGAVHLVEHALLSEYVPVAWAESLAQLMAATGPRMVLSAGTDRGHEVMANLAARTDLPLAANCTEVRPGEPLGVTRQRWGGTLLEDAEVVGTPALLTVAAHAFAAEPTAAPDTKVETFVPELSDAHVRVRISEREPKPAERMSLTEARVVVGGGRGVGGAEGFKALEELASLLGGTVGCSRAVTSAGWRPHSDQIGQTGVRIAPDLYIACGISGATQHIVGCKGAKHILVINTDPEAPILARADYAIVGDVRQVVPALTAEIRKAIQR